MLIGLELSPEGSNNAMSAMAVLILANNS